MPLERGQGKTEAKFLLCVMRASLQQGPRPQVLSSAAPGEPLPAALFGGGAAPVALGHVWVCSLRRKAVVTALLLPGLQPMHQFVPRLFCTALCRHVLETRRAASPHRAPEGGLCLCFLSLFEPASVPVLVQAGRACSSPVPVLLCCLGAGKQLCCRGVCPCLPVLSVPCPAEGAESLLLLVIVSARLGREFCSEQLLGPSSLPPSAGTVCAAQPWSRIPFRSTNCVAAPSSHVPRVAQTRQGVPVLPVVRHAGSEHLSPRFVS